MMLDVTVIQGTQGCGKTTLMRQEAMNSAGRYVFSCPSIELIREQVEWLRQNNPTLSVHEAHTNSPGRMSVAEKIDHAKSVVDNAGLNHAFLFITHEALMSCDFTGFAGWHMRIDEAPASLQSGKIKAKISKGFIRDKLRLAETVGDWSHYVSAAPVKWTDTDGDAIASKASNFFKQANRRTGVFINEKAFAESDEILWFSFWSPAYLQGFASLQISASGYLSSLGCKAVEHFHNDRCTFMPQIIGVPRTGQPAIEILYMTDAHKGSTSFWDKSEGRKCLVEVCDYIAKASPDLGFWSGNDVVYKLMEHRLSGEYISPKAKGLNKFRDQTSCAYIFSSKSTPDDDAIIEVLGINHDDILEDRETEDIRQFVMRGAIRNPNYAGSYLIHLYEKIQAEQLRNHLIASGFANVTLSQATVPHTESYVCAGTSKYRKSPSEKKAHRKIQNRESARKSRERKKQAKKNGRATPPTPKSN